MNWNDYEAIWKRQELPVGSLADISTLKSSFETKRRKLAATLLARDLLEAGAGLLGAGFLGFLWLKTGPTGWPLGAAIILILGVSGVFVRERLRARKIRLGDEAPLLVKVEADLAELQRQRHLLRTIWLWYLGPIFAAILICHFTLVAHTAQWNPLRDPVFSGGFVCFHTFCMGLVWWMNRHAARTQLEPRIAELEKLRRDLAS